MAGIPWGLVFLGSEPLVHRGDADIPNHLVSSFCTACYEITVDFQT